MTPQLLQSIRLLQYTALELAQFVAQEIERNPFLELAEASEQGPDPDGEPERRVDGVLADVPPDAAGIAEMLDTSLENVFADDPGRAEAVSPDLSSQWKSVGASGDSHGTAESDLEDYAVAPMTLREHVAAQIALTFRTPADRLIAAELADMVDECGYLAGDPADVCASLGADAPDVDRVLGIMQRFDPPGLFARSLAECLALQLAARDRYDPAMQAMVAHLDLLAKRDFATLQRICGVDMGDIADMLAEIRALDPRPGLAFAHQGSEAIIPDVSVRAAPDGSWIVELNDAALPRVIVNQSYHARVARTVRNEEERAFLSNCLQQAGWLERSLDQRARTILKVATEIVRQQDGFLIHGVSHLRPLNLRTVADAIGMHESTVSRVTANKFMATPRGVFELRYFFSAAIASAEGGEAHSAEAVRHRIRQLIDAESPDDVLSDDMIVDMLRDKGIDIARRTVAKYRESMNLASSVQRRREKKALGLSRTA